jgi:hypothetical protein
MSRTTIRRAATALTRGGVGRARQREPDFPVTHVSQPQADDGPNGFSPWASFCLLQSQAPGFHPGP